MAPPEAVIDLDLLPAEPDQPGRPRVSWRWVLTVVVAALAGLALTAAAAPASPAVSPVRTVTVANAAVFRLLGDTLYVVEPGQGVQRLLAYPVSGGPARWTARLNMLASPPRLVGIGDTILVMSYDPGPIERAHTQALDRRTGVVLWESPLSVGTLDRARGRVVLGEPIRTDRIDEDRGGTVVAVDAGTGTPVWRYRREAGCQPAVPDPEVPAASVMGVLCTDGTLSAVDLDTGRVRTTVSDVVLLPTTSARFGVDVRVLRDRILVTYPVVGRTVFESYDPQHLTREWRATLDLGNYGVTECGARLCLYSASAGVRALDRATGQTRWELGPAAGAYGLDDRHVLAYFGENQTELVNSETGRPLLRLDGWSTAPFQVGRPLFYRSDRGAHRMWVATLSGDHSALQTLGQVTNPSADVSDCVTSDRYLACRTVKDTIQVWRVRPPD